MRPTTKEKYMTILRFMHEQDKPFTLEEVKVKTNAHTQIMSACKRLGLIEKTTSKYYKWVGDVPTGTTANRLHTKINPSYKKFKPAPKRSINPRPRVRTASLLWGLIKFNY